MKPTVRFYVKEHRENRGNFILVAMWLPWYGQLIHRIAGVNNLRKRRAKLPVL